MQIRIKPAKLLINIDIQKVYPELEDLEITPAAEGQSFKSSKYGFNNVTVKAITSDIDTDIKPENIKEGINILGVDGSYSGIDTSNATAAATDILKDKIAYANGQQITGTIEEYDGSFTGEGSTINVLEESFKSVIDNSLGLNVTKLPNGITSIRTYAFAECTRLKLSELPDTITSIGSHAFDNCANLALTKLPNNLTSMDLYSFYKCTKIAIKEIPAGVTKIPTYCFGQCKAITSLKMLGNIIEISSQAFYLASNLKEVILPNITSIPILGNNAFSNTEIGYKRGYIYVPDNLVESFKTATNWSTYANQIKAISEMEG